MFNPFETTKFSPKQVLACIDHFKQYPNGTVKLSRGYEITKADFDTFLRENRLERLNRGLIDVSNPQKQIELRRFARDIQNRVVIRRIPNCYKLRKRMSHKLTDLYL